MVRLEVLLHDVGYGMEEQDLGAGALGANVLLRPGYHKILTGRRVALR